MVRTVLPAKKKPLKTLPDTWKNLRSIAFSWTFTSLQAHQKNLTTEIIEHLHKFVNLDADLKFRIRFCLQEAITNALLHGNLELPSMPGTLEGMDRFAAELHARMTRPEFANKKIHIDIIIKEDSEIILKIGDEGNGLVKNDAMVERSFFGRGLRLVEQCANDVSYIQDKRTLHIVLKKIPKEQPPS
ncbi:MAG: ATP-binding protein [Holosporales bacterium]